MRANRQLAPHENVKMHMGPHRAGTSNTGGTSNMMSPINAAGASIRADASNHLAVVIELDVNIALSAYTLLGANVNPGAIKTSRANPLLGTIPPLGATFSETPHKNSRILKLRFHVNAVATVLDATTA
jgi:hypothetical protein